jgi:hypothetical protein
LKDVPPARHVLGQHAHDGTAVVLLQPDLPTSRRWPSGWRMTPVDRAHGAAGGAVVDLQAIDLEDHRPRSLGMKTSS